MSAFCVEHGISRSRFYALRRAAERNGAWSIIEPGSRRPRSSPTATPESVRQLVVDVRARLVAEGKDAGAISVHDHLVRAGLAPPSVSTIKRIFRAAGVSRAQPKKRPRSAFRRFVYPAPNCMWQMDATEWVLSRGRTCVIFQIIDDHARLAIASLAATGETAEAAVAVAMTGIARHGVPQRFLTDNGAALNPSRQGKTGKLQQYLSRLGVETMTGKPYKPTTQGKNERFHGTLLRYLEKQPLADSLDELQTQIDAFDDFYNTERGHQSLPARMTPQEAWDATPAAPEPTPPLPPSPPPFRGSPHGEAIRVARPQGKQARLNHLGSRYPLPGSLAGQQVRVIWDPAQIEIFTLDGTSIGRWQRPPRGHHYPQNRLPDTEVSDMS